MGRIEHALAAKEIATALRAGFSKECAITQAARLVKSQGFSAKYAKQVAVQIAEVL